MSRSKSLALFGVLALAAAWLFASATSPRLLQAQAPASETPDVPRTVTVVGEGTVRIKPDIAQAVIGVEVVYPTVEEATQATRELMDAVLAALTDAGVDPTDIQTSGYSVWADRGFEGPMAGDIRYRVSNTVMVTIRDLDQVGAVLDAALAAGANNIYGITFTLSDPRVAESEARAKAVEDARRKAEELAELTGKTVGDVLQISEVIGGPPGMFGVPLAKGLELGGGAGPISPGELELTSQIQITYALEASSQE